MVTAIDKLDKIGREKVEEEMRAKRHHGNCDREHCTALFGSAVLGRSKREARRLVGRR
jgi:hypothetical protein